MDLARDFKVKEGISEVVPCCTLAEVIMQTIC